jgi:hypothetical protein
MAILHTQGIIGAVGSGTGATSATATFGAGVTAGNLVVGFVAYEAATNLLTAVNLGALTATLGTAINNTNNACWITPFYFPGSIVTGTQTVLTAHFSSNVTFIRIIGDEFSGIQTASPLDQATGQYLLAPAGGPTSGSVTPGQSGELIYGMVDDGSQGGGTWTKGAAFTAILEQNTGGQTNTMASEWLVQSVAASIAATFTTSINNTTDAFEIAIMTFMAAASYTPYNRWPQWAPIIAQ